MTSNTTLGAVYVLLGLPGLFSLVTGQLQRGGNPYFAISFMAVPLGALFLLFGLKRFPASTLSENAGKVGGFALAQIAFTVFFWIIVRGGQERFETAYRFMGMFGSFLALVTFVLLIAAAVRGRTASS